jgi:hypothetical protein
MIQHFDRNRGERYYNIFEIVVLFIMLEATEVLQYFNIYNLQTGEFSYRRLFWVIITALSILGFLSLISLTCITYLLSHF